MRISDWSSDVCSSDLSPHEAGRYSLATDCVPGGKTMADNKPTTSGRAVIYARVSTPAQFEHGCSIPGQINRAQEYCDRHDLSVVRIFSDGQSGRTDERRAFQEMERFVLDPDRKSTRLNSNH